MQYIGQHKSAALLSSFLTFSHHSTLLDLAFWMMRNCALPVWFGTLSDSYLHHSTLQNLPSWMMRNSHSRPKLKTDYDYFAIIPVVCWYWLPSNPAKICINPDRSIGLTFRWYKIFTSKISSIHTIYLQSILPSTTNSLIFNLSKQLQLF